MKHLVVLDADQLAVMARAATAYKSVLNAMAGLDHSGCAAPEADALGHAWSALLRHSEGICECLTRA